jgi:hypothetical protein
VRLIRSKGVAVYFITQNPQDIPDTVLGQLGNRVQHALRAYTPKDQKAVKAAAQTFRANPKLDVEAVITELAVGEALVSFLDEKGIPAMVERAWVYPPRSRMQPLTEAERQAVMRASTVAGQYEKPIDRESAYERLKARVAGPEPVTPSPPERPAGATSGAGEVMDALFKSAARAMGSQLGRQVMRGMLGSILGGGSRRRR